MKYVVGQVFFIRITCSLWNYLFRETMTRRLGKGNVNTRIGRFANGGGRTTTMTNADDRFIKGLRIQKYLPSIDKPRTDADGIFVILYCARRLQKPLG